MVTIGKLSIQVSNAVRWFCIKHVTTDAGSLWLQMRQSETSHVHQRRLHCIAGSHSGCLLPVHDHLAHGSSAMPDMSVGLCKQPRTIQ